MFLIGIKDIFKSASPRDKAKRSVAMQMITETLFGYSSEFAVEVYESGLIDELDAGYSCGETGAHFTFGGESNDIDAAYAKFVDFIEQVKENGIDEEAFERARRMKYASFVRSFETTDIAETFSMSLIKNIDWFDMGDIISEITVDEANALIREIFDKKYYVLSVIEPIEKKENDE
jgi:predicted Zn-dependent peptidase